MEKSLQSAELTSRLDFKIVIAVVISIGIFLRFFHLGFQDYWHDEATTSLNIAGHTKFDAFQFLCEHPRRFGELLVYCEPLRDGFATVWKCWTTEQPAKAPLFYVLEYCWACSLGGTVVIMRLLPALLSLLQLPAFYWLGIEIFKSRTTAWLMVALIAISPIAVLYAQEARDYSLYTAMIAFVCAAFLKAVRTQSKQNWLLYTFILIVSLYTSFLIVLPVGAQFAFLIVRRNYKQLREFTFCTVGAAILFSPWIWLNMPHFINGYVDHDCLKRTEPFLCWVGDVLCSYWMPLFYPGEVFLPYQQHRQKIIGLGAVLYSFYKIVRARFYPGPTFLILLLVVGSAPFMVMDLTTGGVRATIVRYMLHVLVVVISCVAYAFSSHCDWNGSWKKALAWWCVFIGFCLCTIDSTLSISTSHTSFLKMVTIDSELRPLADRLNRAQQPATVVADLGITNHVQMFALCRLVKPETKLIFVLKLALKDIPTNLNEFYLFSPTPEFVEVLQKSDYEMKPIPQSKQIWYVRRPPQQ